MRDFMGWSVPLFRAFGVTVRLHLFFFVVTLGLFLREVTREGSTVWWVDVFLFIVVLFFAVTLLHEYGHVFACRAVGGEAEEVLLWPLGGLAFVNTPHNWKAHTLTAAGGPAVNAALCAGCAIALAVGGYLPNLNPLAGTAAGNPYVCEVKNYHDGKVYTSPYGLRLYKPGTAEPVDVRSAEALTAERAIAPVWVVWVQRGFWLNWVLLLFNLLPAYPLDGGQMLQGLLWRRVGYRQATVTACYAGFVVAVLFLIASVTANETLLMGLALFMLYSSATRLHAMEAEEGAFGYDFSAGYTSLERDDPPPARPRKANPLKRWLKARAARRIQREVEARQREEERFDQLLEKVHKSGKASLTDEERRFMERVSARYRNRS